MDRNEFHKLYIGSPAHQNTEEFKVIGDRVVMRYGDSQISTVPAEYGGITIKSVGSTAYNYSDVSSVTISEGIEAIE